MPQMQILILLAYPIHLKIVEDNFSDQIISCLVAFSQVKPV
jgi:hypothetical protein